MVDYHSLSENSKVWVYQSDRPLTGEETGKIRTRIASFISQWTAHDRQLKTFGDVYHHHFIVLFVDETQAGASGCSIDKSVHFLKELEKEFGISLFDRMKIAYRLNGKVEVADKTVFEKLLRERKITSDTPVFNNLVSSKKEFKTQWEIPFGQSWHQKFFAGIA